MDFGDIIYYVLLVFFMILGIFNNSKKKKAEQQSQIPKTESDSPTFDFPKLPETIKNINRRKTPPPVPVTKTETYKRPQFQSSMDLITDFEGESSLKGSIFVDEGDFAESSVSGITTSSEASGAVHPLIKELHRNRLNEIRKGIIYGEILKPKY